MKILVNNEVKELEIIDPTTGCNWEQDLIGNCDGFDGYDEDRELYTMEPRSYSWWQAYIRLEQDLQNRTRVILDKLFWGKKWKFNKALEDACTGDRVMTQHTQLSVIEEWEK